MNIDFRSWKGWHIALLIFAAYNLIVLINIPAIYFSSLQRPDSIDILGSVARVALFNNLWVLITPLILWLGWVFPIAKPSFLRNVFLHLLFAIGAGVYHHAASSIGTWALGISSVDNFQTNLFNAALLMRTVAGTLVHYPVIIISQRAYLYFKESKERAFLQKQAELSALQSQLHPHFFFNTLNALSALIYRSPKEADRMITQLGDLFRILLKKDKAQKIPLHEELEFLEAYLKIHQTLMGDRLLIQWKIDPETRDLMVPNLILQPLVENSIRHGLSPLEEGGILEIGAARQNGHLHLEVTDNGVGIESANKADPDSGIGVKNTRARLMNLYGDEYEFQLEKKPGGGSSVLIKIPAQKE